MHDIVSAESLLGGVMVRERGKQGFQLGFGYGHSSHDFTPLQLIEKSGFINHRPFRCDSNPKDAAMGEKDLLFDGIGDLQATEEGYWQR